MESSQVEVALTVEGGRQEEEEEEEDDELPPKHETKQKRRTFPPLARVFSKVRQARNEDLPMKERRRDSQPESARQQPTTADVPFKKAEEASRMPPVWKKALGGDDGAADGDDLEAKYSIDFAPSFNMTNIRRKFIRKVYLLLTVQLAITALVVTLVLAEPHVNMYFLVNRTLGIACIVIALVVCLILLTLDSTRKNYPWNLIFLCAYTCFASIGLATIAATYAPYLILSGVSITLVICALITVLACQDWIDVTRVWGYLVPLIVVIILEVAGVTTMDILFGYTKLFHTVVAGVFTFAVTVYFFYITQLIIGGKWYQLSPEEYIFAVILLYTGIIRLLLALLGIITVHKD